jgi:hypothetical protein
MSQFLDAVKDSQEQVVERIKNVVIGEGFPSAMEKLMPVLDGVCHLRARARIVQGLINKKEQELKKTGMFDGKIPVSAFVGDIDGEESLKTFVPDMKQRVEKRFARQSKQVDMTNDQYRGFMKDNFGSEWMDMYKQSIDHYLPNRSSSSKSSKSLKSSKSAKPKTGGSRTRNTKKLKTKFKNKNRN